MVIQTFIMEEHHEAFLYWNYFIKQNLIKTTGNYLLHIDHHDDIEGGSYNCDFSSFFSDPSLEEIKDFTYSKLGIADFIIPAIFEGLFSTVHILKNLHPKAIEDTEEFVRLINGNTLVRGKMYPFLHNDLKESHDPEFSFYTMRTGGLDDLKRNRRQPLVLDVDLDYFCWDDSLKSVPPKLMEITETAYKEYMENPYNPFRILPRHLIWAVQKDNKYYLQYQEAMKKEPLPEDSTICKRIDNLLTWMDKKKITPSVIDICRSARSGYLPAEKAKFTETEFLKRLGNVMNIKIKQLEL